MPDREILDELLRKARDAFHEADKAEHHRDHKEAQRLLREAADSYSQLDTMVSLDGKLPWQWDPKQIRVRCDESNNPPEEVEKGNLHVNIDFIPVQHLCYEKGPLPKDICGLFKGHKGSHAANRARWPNTKQPKCDGICRECGKDAHPMEADEA